MAETLGSLIDKLTIKSIREFYLDKTIKSQKSKFSVSDLKAKSIILNRQKKALLNEIDNFIINAFNSQAILREEKLKLYNRPQDIGKIGETFTISKAIEGLAKKNLELWHLEDEARKTDVPLSYIGKVKRKIDLTNQQRNDFIDKIDELFELTVKEQKLIKRQHSNINGY